MEENNRNGQTRNNGVIYVIIFMYLRAVLVSRDRWHSVCAARVRDVRACVENRLPRPAWRWRYYFYQNQQWYDIIANAYNKNNDNNIIPSCCVALLLCSVRRRISTKRNFFLLFT